jgi:predicted RND superfamily exporter protein
MLSIALSRKLARVIVRRPLWVVAALLSTLLGCIWLMHSRQNFDTEVLNLLPQQFESVQALKVLNSEFTQARELTFALRGNPEVVAEFTDHFLEVLRREPWVLRVLAAPPIESPEEVETLTGLLPALLMNLDSRSFAEAMKLLQPEDIAQRLRRLHTEVEAGSLKAEMQLNTDPLGLLGAALRPIVGKQGFDEFSLTSRDGRLRVIPVVTNQPTISQADCKTLMEQVDAFTTRARDTWDGPAPEILVTGRSAYVAQISAGMRHDVGITSTVSIVMVAALFYLGFRRFLPLLGIIVTLGLSCFLAFALGSLILKNLNMIAIAFCSILVGLGDDFSLLLYTRYLQARHAREDHEESVAISIADVGPGILYVCAATGIGFLALLFSGSAGFAQLGTLIAIGILLCGVLMLTVFFLFIRPQWPVVQRDHFGELVSAYLRRVLRAPRKLALPMAGVFALTVCIGLLPFRPLKFDTNPRSLEPKNSPAALALQAITESMPGASQPVVVLVNAKTAEESHEKWSVLVSHLEKLTADGELKAYAAPLGLILSPRQIRENQQILHLTDLDAAGNAFKVALQEEGFNPRAFDSAMNLFPALAKAAGNADLPDLQKSLPESSSWWFLIDRYFSTQSSMAAAYLKPASPLDTAEAQAALEVKLKASGVPLRVTGWSYAMVSLVPWAKRELIIFSSCVGFLILLLLGIAYRRWTPWLIHAASLLFALAGTVATLKLAGLQINMLNALAFPLILGVGVDYGLHVLFAAREENTRTENLLGVLKPLVICGLTTITGFGSLMLARNPALSGLGTVCALGVAWCLASTLLFVLPLAVLTPSGKGAR